MIPQLSKHIRTPVRHRNASQYLLLMLVSFASTVVLTRLFLTLTGFPKIGRGELHIAHLLWGGVALFVAIILMLIYANRWAFFTGAILGGIGTGLFIDEVGKFITSNNDYFYPLAIPIIYSVILIVVVIYLEVRRPLSQDPRAEMYRSLETLQDVLDRDLTEEERTELQERLRRVTTNATVPEMRLLGQTLLDFTLSNELYLAPETPTIWESLLKRLQKFISTQIGRRSLKAFLIVGLGVLGFLALFELLVLIGATISPLYLQQVATDLLQNNVVRSANGLSWFFIQLALEGIVGLLLLLASLFLLLHYDRHAIEIGYFALLMSLTVVNMLVFYFDQFGNVVFTLIQIALLIGLIQYRQLYITPQQRLLQPFRRIFGR